MQAYGTVLLVSYCCSWASAEVFPNETRLVQYVQSSTVVYRRVAIVKTNKHHLWEFLFFYFLLSFSLGAKNQVLPVKNSYIKWVPHLRVTSGFHLQVFAFNKKNVFLCRNIVLLYGWKTHETFVKKTIFSLICHSVNIWPILKTKVQLKRAKTGLFRHIWVNIGEIWVIGYFWAF